MHLVEISTKSTKNMGYAQVTQSPICEYRVAFRAEK